MIEVQLSSCDRNIWLAKPKIFTAWPFTEKDLLIPDLQATFYPTGLKEVEILSEQKMKELYNS